MTNKPLSPAARAVLNAIKAVSPAPANEIAAVALRAVVECAIPVTKSPWGSTLVPVLDANESRNRILNIAAELENN